MNNRWKSIPMLAALTFFAVFAFCILAVLLSGGKIYRKLSERDSLSYDNRTCAQYLTIRVRQAKSSDCVSVAPLDGVESLQISQQIEADTYVTIVYCYEGWLRELFTTPGSGLTPESGEKIMPLQNLSFTLTDGLLTIEYADDTDQNQLLYLQLRGEEAQYAE